MKMNNKNIFKLTVILLLTGMIATFTHCGAQKALEIGDGGGSSRSPSGSNTPKNEGQILNELQVTTGVKNHEQILQSMAAVTGLDPYNGFGAILTVYRQVATSLPTDNDVKLYTSSQQVAITKLAAEFCGILGDQNNGNAAPSRQRVWPTWIANFNQTPAVAFNAQNRQTFIRETIEAFWGPVLTNEELEVAYEEFDILITDIINNETQVNATRRTVRGVCTAALSSAYVTLL